MLQFILGRSGSGKTERVFDAIGTLVRARSERPIVLLVPEQFSFVSERTLLDRFGVTDAANVQVLSFTRLANRILREAGGIATPVMDEVTRALVMSRALEIHTAPENRDQDAPVKPRLYDATYLTSLLALSAECKQCAVTPRLMRAAAAELPEGSLQSKVIDFADLFELYDGLAAMSGLDPEDVLKTAADKLSDTRFTDGACIFVDGFKGFTVTELELLGLLMRTADVTVTLCTDTATETQEDYGLFSPVARSLRQLRQTAEKHGVTIAEPIVLTENHRAQNAALAALEAACFTTHPTVFQGPADTVTVTPCPDVYAECAAVARDIRRLMRETGMRASEIAVIARNLNDYQGVLDTALRRAEIPYYMDEAADVYTMPLTCVCLSALRMCVNGWRTEELLRMMKTGVLPFDEVETAMLENYAFVWRIDGKRWEKPFTANPAGMNFKKAFDQATLDTLESIRSRLMQPLLTLRRTVTGRINGETFAKALYAYLTDPAVAADKGVRNLFTAYAAEGEPVLAERTARLWDIVMGVCDRFATVFQHDALPAARLTELFHLAMGLSRLPSVPQGLDAVQIGSADHIRLQSPAVVCILGANEGVFPAYPADAVLLSDHDREILERRQLVLSSNRLQKAAEERFFAYTSIAAPRNYLFVSYVNNRGGEAALPSVLAESVRLILPNHTRGIACAQDGSDIEYTAQALDRLADRYATDDTVSAVLKKAVSAMPEAAVPLAAMQRRTDDTPFTVSEQNATALFGQDMCLSPSQAESFYRCRFRYFCQYGMNLQTRRVADIDKPMFGDLAHHVLETLLPVYARQKTAPAPADIPAMQQRIHTVLFDFVEQKLGGFADKPARFRYLLSLVERTAFSVLWFTVNEMAQSRFEPADYELVIGEKGIPSIKLPLADHNGSVSIIGKIDRVDIYRRKDTVFVRVVDYKTGKKEFRMGEIPYGINMQMLLYLFSVCQSGQVRYAAQTSAPAGVLYLPAQDITLKNLHAPLDEERLKLLKMSGAILQDMDVIDAMEADIRGVYIPAKVDQKQVFRSNSTISMQDFENLRSLTAELMIGMADTLLSGDIHAVPTYEGDRGPCDYCDFRTVCAREADGPCKEMKVDKPDKVLASLREEDKNDGEA